MGVRRCSLVGRVSERIHKSLSLQHEKTSFHCFFVHCEESFIVRAVWLLGETVQQVVQQDLCRLVATETLGQTRDCESCDWKVEVNT